MLCVVQSYRAVPQQTTDSYVDVGAVWDKRGSRLATLVVTNSGRTNRATYQVYGSIDSATWIALASATGDLATGASAAVSVSDFWPYLKVQARSTSSGNATTVTVAGAAADA